MTDKEKPVKKATKKDKFPWNVDPKDLERAVWFYNRLIDHFPEVYKAWRRIYDRR